MREIKFRVWASSDDYPNGKMYLPEENPDFILNLHGDLIKSVSKGNFESVNTWARISFNEIDVMQFTGLKDKNGKDIYEGDIVSFCKPIRTTQTHTGDNIPNGSYTEPMEPSIEHFEGEVNFENGCFVFEDYNKDGSSYPLEWNIQLWDEESIKDAISYGRPDRFIWDDVEEGDMQYLLKENNFTDLQQLIDYLSGVEVIGNIHENPTSYST